MATTMARPGLSDAENAQLVSLIEAADSVELKLTVPDSDLRSAAAALGIDPLDARISQVYFFDTPELALNRAGVVARARRAQGKPEDSVVKLRPVVPQELPAEVRALSGFGVEVDAMPGGFVCSASMKRTLNSSIVRDVAFGRQPIRKLFSKDQRAFFAENAPDGLTIDDLSILGPILVLKAKFQPKEIGRRFVAELWLYPDFSRILELSTKCVPGEAFQVAAESRAYLTQHGVDLSGEQQTKTKRALEYFTQGAATQAAPTD